MLTLIASSSVSDEIEDVAPLTNLLNPSIYTAAFISATIAAASIFEPRTETLDTGAERSVSSVLSIFSVDIALTII